MIATRVHSTHAAIDETRMIATREPDTHIPNMGAGQTSSFRLAKYGRLSPRFGNPPSQVPFSYNISFQFHAMAHGHANMYHVGPHGTSADVHSTRSFTHDTVPADSGYGTAYVGKVPSHT